MNIDKSPESRACPACGTANEIATLARREYRCSQCNLEMAHLDMASNGVIRGIFGWLRDVGSTIGERYRVASILGKGGFGATYLVEDLRLSGKRRAIKEVPELLFDEYETSLLSRLNHPSIPDIIDRSVADGMVYLVLEFGGSKTLGSERKQHQGRIPLDILLPWMRQLCEVLIYLHSQNPPIIHRDLKPDNILLDETGRIMLIDFGIAKESAPSTMTRTIGRAATLGFSPPEQAMGTGTDERSDIYALGATFYALLTGENPPAAHERVAGKELAPPSQWIPALPPVLEEALLRALSLNVNLRQQSIKEFSLALETLDTAFHGPATHAAEAGARTVLISKRTSPTHLHPPSLKLPSERISRPLDLEKPAQAPGKTSLTHPGSKNAVYLLLGVAAFLVLAITAGYFFWPQPDSQQETAAQPAATTVEIAPPPASGIEPPPPSASVSPAMTPPVAAPPSPTAATQAPPANAQGSAATAFEEEIRKKYGDTPVQPMPTSAPENEPTPSRPKVVAVQNREEAPRKPPTKIRRPPSQPPKQSANARKNQNNEISADVLDELKGSIVQIK
jgi:serine/threonine protein kinase